ncbi:MAG TPA: histidine phosphatase family protein [Burkholderiaceae bacterium]|nr:histidine phosphatase family protein [Burkholderiaceae bacterium]
MARSAARLLLIRHGETAWNAEGRIQGQLDVPLSAKGVWQAQRLAARLASADEGIDAVISSDLARARLTAQPLAEALGLAAGVEPRLRERAFGIFEGHSLDEIEQRWPAAFDAWRHRDLAWAIPGGESALQLIARVQAALADIAIAHAGGTVAVIAHGGVLDVAYRTARDLAWDAPREHLMLNAGINRMAAVAAPLALTILAWGDAAHLDAARDEVTES